MEYIIEIFCSTLIFGYLFYKWANKNFECFSKRNVAHEKPFFLIGNNLTVLEGKETSPELLIRLHNQFKNEKIYGYYGFRTPHFFVRDPELIEKIGIKDSESFPNHSKNRSLLSNETIGSMLPVLRDEKWLEMRNMLAPVFAENEISQVFHIISECNIEAIKYLKNKTKTDEGTEIDFADYFNRYVNDVIASAAFGLEINSYKDEANEFSNMTTVLLRTRSLCAAVKSFYLTVYPQALRIYRLNRIYIKALAYVKRLIGKSIQPQTQVKISNVEGSIENQKTTGTEFLNIIKALLKKSSSAIISVVLTIFPQISIIFSLFSFVQTIRNYIRSLFNPKLREHQIEEVAQYHDIDTDRRKNKNQFLYISSAILKKIGNSIKLLILTIFPQIILISRIFFLTKAVLNYLRGKTMRQEVLLKNRKKKLSKMESALLKFERFIVVLKLLFLTYLPKMSMIFKLQAFNTRSLNYLKNSARQTIHQRQNDHIVRLDMIHLMIEARKQKEEKYENDAEEKTTFIRNATKCTEDELISQCIMFLFAGLGPMSNMLCATVYELMKNPEIQEKLFEEVSRINSELDGAEASYEKIQNMKYLDMIVSETLRKWPSQPLIDRICSKPYILTNSAGEVVADFKPDDVVCFSVYGSHFDKEYFENPFTFDPERFSEQKKSSIRPLTYFPFGVGARNCLGQKFGLMVVKIMLYHLVLEFKFAPGPRSIPDLFASHRKIQLKQSDFYWMKIIPRITEQVPLSPCNDETEELQNVHEEEITKL
ncbi:cytochrome P450 3A7 [Eupeodes corollae]|uniref:cytochrome P450 3A7 n=1 Tax=Eupeodes corollae TaxID=290404 RepID=UPI00249256E8|nr:cytochrome P450 3A7 [Eupeodes corollae]